MLRKSYYHCLKGLNYEQILAHTWGREETVTARRGAVLADFDCEMQVVLIDLVVVIMVSGVQL